MLYKLESKLLKIFQCFFIGEPASYRGIESTHINILFNVFLVLIMLENLVHLSLNSLARYFDVLICSNFFEARVQLRYASWPEESIQSVVPLLSFWPASGNSPR